MTDLRQLVPIIRRAREYHLYTVAGKRYLDLWQEGGRALLGHRPGRLTTALKNTISKGLIADLPSVYSGRLLRLLRRMYPDYRDFRFTCSPAEGLQLASLYLGRTIAASDVADPLIVPSADSGVSLWRPLLPDPPSADVLFPVLPFSMAAAPFVVCFRSSLPRHFPAQHPVSAVLLAGLLRCLHDLQRFQLPQWYRPDLLADCPGWRQEECYVVPAFEQARYEQIFAAFLDAQVLLNPVEPYVSILPGGEISNGERRKMIGLFRRFPGE